MSRPCAQRLAIFWQTQKTTRAANPGGRVPRRRALAEPVMITVDTRKRYPYRFVHQGAGTARATVAAGDYAIRGPDGRLLAAVERKSLDNLTSTLSDGTLAFQLPHHRAHGHGRAKLTPRPKPTHDFRPLQPPQAAED